MGVENNVLMKKYIVYMNEQNNYQIAVYGRMYSL